MSERGKGKLGASRGPCRVFVFTCFGSASKATICTACDLIQPLGILPQRTVATATLKWTASHPIAFSITQFSPAFLKRNGSFLSDNRHNSLGSHIQKILTCARNRLAAAS
jgi:hypothetical protein